MSCKMIPGAHIRTDHNLLLARTKFRLKKITKIIFSRKTNVRELTQDNILQQTTERINYSPETILENNNHDTEIEEL